MINSHDTNRKTTDQSYVARLLSVVAGIDNDRLRNCPPGDRLFVARMGLQLLTSTTFLFGIFASAMLIGFGHDLLDVVIVLVMSFLAAGVVFLLDCGIVQADFYQQGLVLAKARGFGGPAGDFARAKRFAAAILRLVLSVVIAFAFATFFELRLFGNDIERQINLVYQKANATLYDEVARSYDGDIVQQDRELSRLAAVLTVLHSREDKLLGQATDPADLDREIASTVKALTDANEEKRASDAEAARRDGDAINEHWGEKEAEHQSGRPGDGNRFNNARERGALAKRTSERKAIEIQELHKLLEVLRERRMRHLEQAQRSTDSVLARLRSEIDAAIKMRADTSEAHRTAIAQREARITTTAMARPEYVAKPDGFLTRVEALEVLREKPAVWWNSVWAKAIIMLIEVSAVLSKVFFSTPTLYALRTAIDFESTAHDEIKNYDLKTMDVKAETVKSEMDAEDLRMELLRKREERLRKEAVQRELYRHYSDDRHDNEDRSAA